jgi:thiamine-monophosphate kinase
MTIGEIGERALLRRLRSRIPAGLDVRVGLGDDAAVVATDPLTLVTTDCQVEGVHFRPDWSPPALIGRKSLSVNLSDIAAMGGFPRFATVSLCLRRDVPWSFIDGLYDGLLERSAESGVSVVGGNVSAIDGPVVIDITLLGRTDQPLCRSGAQAGDVIVVTGYLGAAAAGLRLLKQGARLTEEGRVESTGMWTESSAAAVQRCLRAQLDPTPPLAFARLIAEQGLAHAAIDISDGLSGDLLTLCEENGIAATVRADQVPIDPYAAGIERARGGDPLWLALHGGEDYQLLLAVAPERLDDVRDHAQMLDMPLAVVGELGAGEPALSLEIGGELLPLTPASHEHFKSRGSSVKRG